MSQIKVENLSFAYPGSYDEIFKEVCFQIDTDWKLGFVGRNGRGKTTFLQLLLGEYEYSGKITAPVQFEYFPYFVEHPEKNTKEILGGICPLAQDWEFSRELAYLDVAEEAMHRPFFTLSKGEQTKVLLAALFLNEGCFLLIDEPTNHLDQEGRRIVSNYLQRKKGFILVSHDGTFLDGCVNHILSINRTNIEIQKGNFSSWMENFTRQQGFEEAEHRRLEKDVSRLEQGAKRTAAWSNQVEASKNGMKVGGLKPDKGRIGHKAAKMMKRMKSIERRQEKALEETKGLLKNVERLETLSLEPLTFPKDVVAAFSEVVISYENCQSASPVTFTVERGDRVALCGKNGSGKSSLLKLLLGERIPYTGMVHVAAGLTISYVPQDTAHLQGSLKAYAQECGIEESLFKSILRKMDFERIQFEKDMIDFSSGQKKKVLLARSLCQKAHLYVWDEPLNFIDVYTWMQVETLLLGALPTMIFVEHDRGFVEKIATKIVVL